MMAFRGHDEFYDMEDLHKAFEDGRKQGWREAMEEAQKSERHRSLLAYAITSIGEGRCSSLNL